VNALAEKVSLSNFIKKNKTALYEAARKNATYNINGQPTISEHEDWFDEDHWDNHYKEMEDNK
jgi:hypothetical protein